MQLEIDPMESERYSRMVNRKQGVCVVKEMLWVKPLPEIYCKTYNRTGSEVTHDIFILKFAIKMKPLCLAILKVSE